MAKRQQSAGPQQKPSDNTSLKDKSIQSIRSLGERFSGVEIRNPVRSVGMKLFLAILLLTVLMVLAVGLVSYSAASSIIKDKVSASSQDAIVQAGGKLDILLQQYEQKTLDFLVDPKLTEQMRNMTNPLLEDVERYDAQRNLQQSINGIAVADGNIKAIHLALMNGTIMTSGSFVTTGLNPEDYDWYNRALERNQTVWLPTVKGGLFDTTNDTDTYGVSRKIVDVTTGQTIGVLLIELNASSLEKALSSLIDPEGVNHIAVLDESGQYVFSDVIELIQTSSNIQIVEDSDTGRDENGREALIATSVMPTTGWTMIGTYPVDTLVKDARTILWTTLWTTLAGALVAMLLSYAIVQLISRPLTSLRKLMKEGEQGNLLVRTNFKRQDEFGELGISFNQMMEKITQLVKQTNESVQQVLDNANELLEASRKTALSAREISVATEEIANGASTLAMEAEKGNDLTSHIRKQMKGAVEANLQMGASAQVVRAVSEQGITYMNDLTTKTGQTEEKTRQMADKVNRLKESTASIRKILDVLNNVTKQTNILSLNATIEAARAGTAGKGFMVVADEIRKLADQSRQSIDVVAQITEAIQTEIEETVSAMAEAYPIYQEQIESVKEADKIFKDVQNKMVEFIGQLDEVTESIQQLEHSQEDLSVAISNVSAVSQQSSATSEEVASLSSEQLNVSEGLVALAERLESVSVNLKETLAKFKV